MRFELFFLFFFSSTVLANNNCEVSLNFGILVTDKQIRIIDDGGRTVYQINGNSQLFVKGEWIELDQKQNQTLSELSKGFHKVVPKMIFLANEGVELAVATIEKVYGGLVKDDASQQKLQKSLKQVKMSVKEKFIQSNNHFYMGPGRLEQVDDLVDKELEEQIEQAINTSVGGVLSAIGGLVVSEQTTEEKVAAIAKQLENSENNINSVDAPPLDMLKHKARWFCKKFKQLDGIEEELKSSISELNPYDVLTTGRAW
ncbi:DUF2884 family protein [Paraglaciecola sp. L3A3]|uniref:DUF2884 family protein n=1 Tax=Paraglaciecola sp. L3A3 TaxID=2686358 RepID=UPI00131EA2DC|nr:DUF2884 family protein [Paraglaciecola sp. L3A3]